MSKPTIKIHANALLTMKSIEALQENCKSFAPTMQDTVHQLKASTKSLAQTAAKFVDINSHMIKSNNAKKMNHRSNKKITNPVKHKPWYNKN